MARLVFFSFTKEPLLVFQCSVDYRLLHVANLSNKLGLKTSVLPVALPKKQGRGSLFFIFFYFPSLCYFPELHAIKR